MEPVTYSLHNGKVFYQELSTFTTDILNSRSQYSLTHVQNFINFKKESASENLRTFDEYYLEYLTIGTLLRKYSSNAMSTGIISMAVLKTLYRNRNRIAALKPSIDKVRGLLSTLLLSNKFLSFQVNSAAKFRHFLKWLDATGEFSEETLRLKSWYVYLKSLTGDQQNTFFEDVAKDAEAFEISSKKQLGTYTKNVDKFRKDHLPEHKYQENYIFCGRHEVEYHLNMFGAEILNRALKNDYSKTTKKVILLPTCMSRPKSGKCKARVKANKLTCTECSPECNICIKKKEYALQNTEVVLIPHSSEFTKYLKHWKNQKTTGLIGVACVLNLLKGGYEMQKLNIPSQCVFLDYCGCKKHWHKDGIPTNINSEQLKRVVV